MLRNTSDNVSPIARIAVIDDDALLREMMETVLDERAWETIGLPDSAAAVDAVREQMPDAVVLDIGPRHRRNGWAVLEELQSDSATRTIPVLVWSGDMLAVDAKRDWLNGRGIPVLAKPFDLDVLFTSLDTLLERGIASVTRAG